MTNELKCDRKACCEPIYGRNGNDRAFRIWNSPNTFPAYRDYCFRCGKKIIQFNIDNYGIELAYTILLPKLKTNE